MDLNIKLTFLSHSLGMLQMFVLIILEQILVFRGPNFSLIWLTFKPLTISYLSLEGDELLKLYFPLLFLFFTIQLLVLVFMRKRYYLIFIMLPSAVKSQVSEVGGTGYYRQPFLYENTLLYVEIDTVKVLYTWKFLAL